MTDRPSRAKTLADLRRSAGARLAGAARHDAQAAGGRSGLSERFLADVETGKGNVSINSLQAGRAAP